MPACGSRASGRPRGISPLFEKYSPQVYRTILRMLNAPEDAADLTQDVFVRAWERLRNVKDGQAFQAWLLRLTVNKCAITCAVSASPPSPSTRRNRMAAKRDPRNSPIHLPARRRTPKPASYPQKCSTPCAASPPITAPW